MGISVAQAVARKLLHDILVDQKIALYLLSPKEPCKPLMRALGTSLAVVGYAAEYQGLNPPELSILRGGLSACDQMAKTDSYDPINTTAIVRALDIADDLNRKVYASSIQQAWAVLHAEGR